MEEWEREREMPKKKERKHEPLDAWLEAITEKMATFAAQTQSFACFICFTASKVTQVDTTAHTNTLAVPCGQVSARVFPLTRALYFHLSRHLRTLNSLWPGLSSHNLSLLLVPLPLFHASFKNSMVHYSRLSVTRLGPCRERYIFFLSQPQLRRLILPPVNSELSLHTHTHTHTQSQSHQ